MNKNAILSACAVGLMIGVAGLINLIGRVRKLIKESIECVLPVVPNQKFEFSSPGEKCLHLQGPRFTTAFFGVKFAIKDIATGEEIALRPIIFRMVTSGISRARIFTHRCMVTHAGRYELVISGIREGADYADCNIIFTRPYRATAILLILGLVFTGMLTIASVVFGIMAIIES